ncbi:MAG: hypothetical protein ACE5FA_03970, partial [Dehalococcoidia bacterium]
QTRPSSGTIPLHPHLGNPQMRGRRRGSGEGERGPSPSFYERALLREALRSHAGKRVEVDDHLSEVLRRLREVLARHPDDVKLLLRGTDVLSRAAAAEKRMSRRDRDELAANVQAALDQLEGQLL